MIIFLVITKYSFYLGWVRFLNSTWECLRKSWQTRRQTDRGTSWRILIGRCPKLNVVFELLLWFSSSCIGLCFKYVSYVAHFMASLFTYWIRSLGFLKHSVFYTSYSTLFSIAILHLPRK